MNIFVILFVIGWLLSFLCSYKKRYSKIAYGFLFFVMLLPMILRYGVGTDYYNYIEIVKNSGLHGGSIAHFEIGWYPIVWFIRILHLPPHSFFVITSFLTLYFIFKTLDRELLIYTFPAIFVFIYLVSYNTVRQSFACVLVMYAFRLYLNGDTRKALFFFLISFLFHKVVVFFLPFIIVLGKWNFTVCNVWFLVFFLFLFLEKVNLPITVLSFLSNKIVFSSYFSETSSFSKEWQSGTGLFVLFKEFLIMLILLFCRPKRIDGKRNVFYSDFIVLGLLIFISLIFSKQMVILVRLAELTTPFIAFMIEFLVQSKGRFRKLALLGVEAFLIVINIITIFVASYGTGLGIMPYQIITF